MSTGLTDDLADRAEDLYNATGDSRKVAAAMSLPRRDVLILLRRQGISVTWKDEPEWIPSRQEITERCKQVRDGWDTVTEMKRRNHDRSRIFLRRYIFHSIDGMPVYTPTEAEV